MKLRWILLVIGLLVAVGLGMGITKMNMKPFFIDTGVGVGGLHARIYEFQPYYLWSYEKDGGMFAKVFYIRNKWIPQIATLWLSGKYKDTDLEAVDFYENKDAKAKFGQRINVIYLTGENLEITGAVENTKGCGNIPRICKVYFYTKERVDIFSRFSRYGIMAWGQPLPVLCKSVNSHSVTGK